MNEKASSLSVTDIKSLINIVGKTLDLNNDHQSFNNKSLEKFIYELKDLLDVEGGALGTCAKNRLNSSPKNPLCSWNTIATLTKSKEIFTDRVICENTYENKGEVSALTVKPNSFVSCKSQGSDFKSCLYLEYNQHALNKKEEDILDIILPFIHNTISKYHLVQNKFNIPDFTKRESEVMKWIYAGKDNWSISRILNITERTVKFHNNNIYKKLNVASRLEAVSKFRNI